MGLWKGNFLRIFMQASTKKGGVHININPCCVCDSLFIFYPQHCVITSRWLVYFIGIPFQAIKESERGGYQSTYRKPVVRMYVSHLKWMASGGIRTMAIQSSLPWSQTSVSSPPHWTPSLRQLTHTHSYQYLRSPLTSSMLADAYYFLACYGL